MTYENQQKNEHLYAWLEFAFEVGSIAALGPRLREDRMDGWATTAMTAGGIAGMAFLIWLASQIDENQKITGADLAFGIQLPICGLLLGIGARHAVPAIVNRTRTMLFSNSADQNNYFIEQQQALEDPFVEQEEGSEYSTPTTTP